MNVIKCLGSCVFLASGLSRNSNFGPQMLKPDLHDSSRDKMHRHTIYSTYFLIWNSQYYQLVLLIMLINQHFECLLFLFANTSICDHRVLKLLLNCIRFLDACFCWLGNLSHHNIAHSFVLAFPINPWTVRYLFLYSTYLWFCVAECNIDFGYVCSW